MKHQLRKKSILSIVMMVFSLSVVAQTFKSDTVKNKTINVFNSPSLNKDYERARFGFGNNDGYRFAMKVNPLLAIYGDIPIYAEYRFAEKFSTELGVGITIRNFWLEAIDDTYSNPTGKTPDKMGNSFRLALRFYPSSDDDAIEGYYFASEFMTRNYYSINSYSYYNGISDETVEYQHQTRQTDYKIAVGYQEALESNIIIDYYVGFGLRKQEREVIDTDFNSSTYTKTIYQNTRNITFALGIKIGFGF